MLPRNGLYTQYVGHSCINDRPTADPRFLIKSIHQFLILSASAALFTTAAVLPGHADAFWPFSTNADASAATFAPASGTPALEASTNIDPNPNKGLGDIQTSGGRALLAYSGPAGTTADVVGTTQSDSISVYVVRPGDTLSEIADMFDVSVNTIIWANNLSGPSDVHPGDTLVILPISGVEHTVKKGDTLKSIAKKYSGDADEIAVYNGLDASAALEVGTTVIVPGGEIASETPARRITTSTAIKPGAGGTVISGYFSNPVPGAILTQSVHGSNGIDLGAARGTPIRAAAPGTVIISRSNGAWNGGYGNYVVIKHNNGTQTLYSHLSNAIVAVGQSVTSGQTIGYMGSTGKSTGVHLHFEVRGAANPLRGCAVGTVCSLR